MKRKKIDFKEIAFQLNSLYQKGVSNGETINSSFFSSKLNIPYKLIFVARLCEHPKVKTTKSRDGRSKIIEFTEPINYRDVESLLKIASEQASVIMKRINSKKNKTKNLLNEHKQEDNVSYFEIFKELVKCEVSEKTIKILLKDKKIL